MKTTSRTKWSLRFLIVLSVVIGGGAAFEASAAEVQACVSRGSPLGIGADPAECAAGDRVDAISVKFALSAQPNFLAAFDAGRNFYAQRLGVAVAPTDGYLRFAPEHGRAERNRQLVFEVGAARGRFAAAVACSAAMAELPEEVGEAAPSAPRAAGGRRVDPRPRPGPLRRRRHHRQQRRTAARLGDVQ